MTDKDKMAKAGVIFSKVSILPGLDGGQGQALLS
jgi:hypothetical protein